ncbi:MAG: translation initiation factor IF-2 N-terminal domain-containing protein, partial [Candidatus Acidiferrales bacterium]
MSDANQIRINELARELEIKAKVLIDYLPEIGVTEKKTHSSSIDVEHAELARKHFQDLAAAEVAAEAAKTAAKNKPARPAMPAAAPPPRPTAPAGAPISAPVSATPGAAPRPVAAPPATGGPAVPSTV